VIREPLPIPSLETIFEVTVNGRVHKVPGVKLQRWIMKRRSEWKGPRGMLFSQRPILGPKERGRARAKPSSRASRTI
jgi:hypothetical protein